MDIKEVVDAMAMVEKRYNICLNQRVCFSLVENIEKKIKDFVNNFKRERDWFKKIIHKEMDNLDINNNNYSRRKAYMIFIGKIFGEHSCKKSAENKLKRKKEEEKEEEKRNRLCHKNGKVTYKTFNRQKYGKGLTHKTNPQQKTFSFFN